MVSSWNVKADGSWNSGTFGDFASFVSHMKEIAVVRVFFSFSSWAVLNLFGLETRCGPFVG